MEVSQEIRDIAEVIRQAVPAEQIYLFGSYAYGEPNEHSDYDFYVVIPDGSMRPIEAMQRAQHAVSPIRRKTRMPIDILAGTRNNFDEMKKMLTLERTIVRKGILL